ncbi:MAG: nucleoside hydrolase [Hyphomicrobiales bacterium]|nr:MAG: nucleoside hydrolase [Hyphomicrobiales bacterium]
MPLVSPRARVIIDNDFSGDPDDLFQTAHHLLSPSVEVPLIVASHLSVGDPWDPTTMQATNATARVNELLSVMGMGGQVKVLTGSEVGILDGKTPQVSAATEAIIAEAMRDDKRPLYYAAGAGLTELASAWLMEPRIAERLTLVWIGGHEHPGLALPPPGSTGPEYNLRIDIPAGQVVFNDSAIPIWQVPRNVYRQFLFTHAEMETQVRPHGPLGAYLANSIEKVMRWTGEMGRNIGETYALGDSPLVTLTALQSSFEADPSSSSYLIRPAPKLDAQGSYLDNPAGRPIRIYTDLRGLTA